jgi:hypothetical protein
VLCWPLSQIIKCHIAPQARFWTLEVPLTHLSPCYSGKEFSLRGRAHTDLSSWAL